jgi:2-(1,2-epoxy-1,2-dihydrophenyl)acetyl-CoA isomerase
MGEELLYHLENRVAVLTLNRPERLNALTRGMMQSLLRHLAACAVDDAVGCMVLTGAGNAFCAGGDVRVQAKVAAEGTSETPEQRTDQLRASMEASRLLHEMPKPTIAMMNGVAAGAGLSLALACDLRIAGRSARMTTAFAKVGLSGDYGGTWFLTQLVGPAKARELYFLSDLLDADQIEQLGLAVRIVGDDKLGAETLALAERLGNGPRVAFRYMKRNLNVAISGSLASGLDSEAVRHVAVAAPARTTRRRRAPSSRSGLLCSVAAEPGLTYPAVLHTTI